jgi:hypothetical protein
MTWRRLAEDEQGAAVVEAVVALPILLIVFLQVLHFGFLLAADLIVERAAMAAVRAAVVFLPDDPKYYPDPSLGTRRQYIAEAARLVLIASPHFDPSALEIQVEGTASGFSPITVRVNTLFDCTPFLAAFVCGADRRFPLHAEATLPAQAD